MNDKIIIVFIQYQARSERGYKMEYMDLFDYNGEKVITTENISEYKIEQDIIKHIKDQIYKTLKNETSIYLRHNEAKKYGQIKNFNYSRGMWLYSVKNVKEILSNNPTSLSRVIDVDSLLADINNGVIRRMSEDRRNKPKSIPNKKADDNKTTNEKEIVNTKPTVNEVELNSQIPIDEVYAFIDRLDEIHQKSNNQLISSVTNLMEKVELLTNKVEELTKKLEESKNESISKSEQSILIMKEDSTYDEWKKNIKRAVKLISDVDGRTENEILHEAYDRLRSQYTIVWEQETKEFREDFGRGPINTMELCWWLETKKKVHKNLLIGKLNTIYSDAKRASIKIVE